MDLATPLDLACSLGGGGGEWSKCRLGAGRERSCIKEYYSIVREEEVISDSQNVWMDHESDGHEISFCVLYTIWCTWGINRSHCNAVKAIRYAWIQLKNAANGNRLDEVNIVNLSKSGACCRVHESGDVSLNGRRKPEWKTGGGASGVSIDNFDVSYACSTWALTTSVFL